MRYCVTRRLQRDRETLERLIVAAADATAARLDPKSRAWDAHFSVTQ
ncbi:MAG TPA: hypothetical protein VKG63_01730 [Steroidobacteraceae bacterium]|nr:hypothetical protein [Steroidobacteraceae bacterium]